MTLTPKQLRVLEFIRDFIREKEYAPTLEEIARRFRISKITALQHVRSLEKRGAIKRSRYIARSIELKPAARKPLVLPLVGVIAAGVPIEALEQRDVLDLADMIEGKKEPFLLRVKGDSMIEEQIRDGDFVIVERRLTATNGETVVAVLDNGEATLKKFYQDPDGRVRLQPANAAMQPIFPAKLDIRGVAIGVVRKY